MVLHHPPKQRQTRAHKAVFHFKTGPLVQTDAQQTVPSAHAGGPAHRPGELVAAVTRNTGKASPIVGNPGGKGPVALVRILSYRLGKVEVVNNQRISVTQQQSVLDAKKMANRGVAAKDIKAILNENNEKKLNNETIFSENSNQEINGNELKSNSVIKEVGKAIEQFLQPTYVFNSDDELLRKKKRKSR